MAAIWWPSSVMNGFQVLSGLVNVRCVGSQWCSRRMRLTVLGWIFCQTLATAPAILVMP